MGGKQLFPLARDKAERERDYRQALAREIMSLKQDKTPVSLISDLARGNVAEVKFSKDLAEAKWQAARDSIEAIKAQLSGLQTIFRHQTEIEGKGN